MLGWDWETFFWISIFTPGDKIIIDHGNIWEEPLWIDECIRHTGPWIGRSHATSTRRSLEAIWVLKSKTYMGLGEGDTPEADDTRLAFIQHVRFARTQAK